MSDIQPFDTPHTARLAFGHTRQGPPRPQVRVIPLPPAADRQVGCTLRLGPGERLTPGGLAVAADALRNGLCTLITCATLADAFAVFRDLSARAGYDVGADA